MAPSPAFFPNTSPLCGWMPSAYTELRRNRSATRWSCAPTGKTKNKKCSGSINARSVMLDVVALGTALRLLRCRRIRSSVVSRFRSFRTVRKAILFRQSRIKRPKEALFKKTKTSSLRAFVPLFLSIFATPCDFRSRSRSR